MKSGKGADESYQPGPGENPKDNIAGEHTRDSDEENWQGNKPGTKVGDAASNDDKPEPKKYKNFWKKFGEEIRKKSGK